MSRTIELPEPVFNGLIAAARAGGVTPADWIAEKLPEALRAPASDEELRAARDRLWQHVVSLGYPTGTDNDQIDADLARSYLDTHEDEAEPGPRP